MNNTIQNTLEGKLIWNRKRYGWVDMVFFWWLFNYRIFSIVNHSPLQSHVIILTRSVRKSSQTEFQKLF